MDFVKVVTKLVVTYDVLSGTSMVCPHVTAAVAYVKSFHPSWSPSAIKSALMTTAWKFFDGLHPEAEFAYGSGHINALMATDFGLVYETLIEEYLKVGCNTSPTNGRLTATNVSCPSDREINYPSMAVLVDMQSFVVSFPRTVTNVGQANSTYVAAIDGELLDLLINVAPSTLHFTALNENLSFVVTVMGKRMKPLTTRRASLVWTDGVYKVYSPLVLYRLNGTSGVEKPNLLRTTILSTLLSAILKTPSIVLLTSSTPISSSTSNDPLISGEANSPYNGRMTSIFFSTMCSLSSFAIISKRASVIRALKKSSPKVEGLDLKNS
ncbi:subtilisin-like protease SBT4.3 [Tanacetum coccineum]